MTTTDKPTPCWYVKDFADGWIKFYDVQCALTEAQETGAIMRYAHDGKYPDRPSELRQAGVDGGAALDALETMRSNGCLLPQRIQSQHWQNYEIVRTALASRASVDVHKLATAFCSEYYPDWNAPLKYDALGQQHGYTVENQKWMVSRVEKALNAIAAKFPDLIKESQ